MKQYLDKIITGTKEIAGAYPVLKLLGVSLLGVLGGSGFITFINRYAIYNYSVSYGARLPAESVPYIDVAISILSFAFLGISLAIALLAYGVLTFVANFIHKHIYVISEFMSKVLAGIFTSILGIIGSAIFEPFINDSDLKLEYDLLITSVIVLVVGGILTALIIKKSLIRPFAIASTLFLVFFVSSRLFDATNYASFLREIQYGGGVSVTAFTKESNNEISGYLFLTTRDKYVIWDKEKSQFEELNINNSIQINYHENKAHELPEIRGSILSLFRHLWKT